jgi:hypothetical protein
MYYEARSKSRNRTAVSSPDPSASVLTMLRTGGITKDHENPMAELNSEPSLTKILTHVAEGHGSGHQRHKSKKRRFVERWDVVYVEDLNLKSLAKTKQAKSWFDASFGELFRQLAYKSRWDDKHFVQVDRLLASSKLCSACG